MLKKRVAVIFGGKSPEHEVSIITGIQTIEHLDKEKFDVTPVYIAKDGKWYAGEALGKIETYKNLDAIAQITAQQTISLDSTQSGLIPVEKKSLNPFKKSDFNHFDIIFPTFHGGLGENGGASGLFEMMDVPYVGPGITGGVLGMDKVVMKQVLSHEGVPLAKWDWFYRADYEKNPKKIIEALVKNFTFPLFVKPASGGSSIGTNKVKTSKELENAIEVACVFDTKIIVEESIENAREINISVIGNAGGELAVSVCEEVFSTSNLLTYEDKYLHGDGKKGGKSNGMASTNRKIPADLPQEIIDDISRTAQKVFHTLNAAGVSRIDFLYQEKSKKIYVIEINTIPGSLSFYLWEASGLSFKNMLTKLIDLAVLRHEDNKKNMTTFTSNILENFDSQRGTKSKI